MKVYCKDCKHFLEWDCGIYECHSNPEQRSHWRTVVLVFADPSEKNNNNACPEWSPNLRYRLAKWKG